MSICDQLFHETFIWEYLNHKTINAVHNCNHYRQVISKKKSKEAKFVVLGDGEVDVVWENIGKRRGYDSTSDSNTFLLSYKLY